MSFREHEFERGYDRVCLGLYVRAMDAVAHQDLGQLRDWIRGEALRFYIHKEMHQFLADHESSPTVIEFMTDDDCRAVGIAENQAARIRLIQVPFLERDRKATALLDVLAERGHNFRASSRIRRNTD